LFQAKVFALGQAYVPAPSEPQCFNAPFVLDYAGKRFGKYPPGWPALLALGVIMGQPWWVNAACTALSLALTFRLGTETNSRAVGLLAAALAVTSPFLLLLSGSMMAHPACLTFTTAFFWCFRRSLAREVAFWKNTWAALAGVMLGNVFAIRPYTASAVLIATGLLAAWRLLRQRAWQNPLWLLAGFVLPALSVPAFNALVTGNAFLSLYELAWPFDRLGFGPGHGVLPSGHTVWAGLGMMVTALAQLSGQLHGWPGLSLVFVIALFWLKPKHFWNRFLGGVTLAIMLAYVFYWTAGSIWGPRYYSEATSALLILSAAGITQMFQRIGRHRPRRQKALLLALLALVGGNLLIYLPWQLESYRNLYGITGSSSATLQAAALDNALVIVQDKNQWQAYAVPFSLNSPLLNGKVVYARDCGSSLASLQASFPARKVYTFDGLTVQPYTPRTASP
jgi:4-amino-4-deoxy-L-arabinose transferase-like glycosyltransferase